MTQTVRVFVNAAGIDVPAGSTALDAVRTWSAAAADDVKGGRRLMTDSRGLPLDIDAPVSAGSIVRLIVNRGHDSAGPADSADEPE